MQYFEVSPGKFIQFDDITGQVQIIIKSDLVALQADLVKRISSVDPNIPKTNAEWIALAKKNYQYIDHSQEESELANVKATLEGINAL
jgi:hypothetical protein